MSEESQIFLKTTSILCAPLHIYEKDFTFIVNGEEFKTSKIISDILSPKICQIHCLDPTFDVYTIKTKEKGHFSIILNLTNFQTNSIPNNEIPFIAEVIENLGNKSISLSLQDSSEKITNNNVFNLLKKHDQFSLLYSNCITNEIDFISSHFFELCEEHLEEVKQLSFNTLKRIFTNKKLKLTDEDQLLNLLNQLYTNDSKYNELFECIIFTNVSVDSISEFLSVFNFDDITHGIWHSISDRLKQEIEITNYENHINRYSNLTSYKNNIKDDQFDGIISYLIKTSKGNISNEISITSSSIDDSSHQPLNSISFDDKSKYFASKNENNSWLCFDFKNKKITKLTNYKIRTYTNGSYHMKSFILEGSKDNSNWTPIDTQNNCSQLNKEGNVKCFAIKNKIKEKFRYIRIRITDTNWYGNYCMRINSLELYGSIK